MIRKSSPTNASFPDWAHLDRVGGIAPTSVLARDRRETFLTVAEAAALLRVSEKTVRRLITHGDLKAVRIGRSVRIHFTELENLIAGGGARASGSGDGGGYV